MRISIIGSGAWGTALALLMRYNGYDVTIWSKYEDEAENLRATRENPRLRGVMIPADIGIDTDIEAAIDGASAVMITVPSFAVRETMEILKGKLPDGCVIISMSKGI